MNNITIDKPYIIKYSNSLHFAGRLLAFRKKLLFDITTGIPQYIPRSNQGWWVNRKLLTRTKAAQITTNVEVSVDVTHLQWYQQLQYDECIKLNIHKIKV